MSDLQSPRPLGPAFTTALFRRIGVDRYTVAPSLLGPVCLGWTARGIAAVRLAGSANDEAAFIDWYRERMGRKIVRAVERDTIAATAVDWLRDPTAAAVPLDLDAATPFERSVLAWVAEIRPGYARPCELVAADVDRSCDPAAVARVLANNAVPLFVPCHRVVHEGRCCSADYVFGAAAQERLLTAEGLDAAAIDRIVAAGFRYIENEGYFCLPTCGDVALRFGSPGITGLRSLAEARARGLQECDSCRPVAA